MAEALIPLGRCTEAHDCANKASSIIQAKLPPDHPFVVLCLAELGLADYAMGDKTGVKTLWNDVLERMPRAYRKSSRTWRSDFDSAHRRLLTCRPPRARSEPSPSGRTSAPCAAA
jgi:hypothetical protein